MSEIPPLTIDPDAPPDPVYVLELAEALAEIARALNRLTRHREALHYPSEAHELVQHLAVAAGRLPQLLGQVSRWIGQEQDGGRLAAPAGEFAGEPGRAAVTAMMRLDAAVAAAGHLREDLDEAAQVLAGIAAAEGPANG